MQPLLVTGWGSRPVLPSTALHPPPSPRSVIFGYPKRMTWLSIKGCAPQLTDSLHRRFTESTHTHTQNVQAGNDFKYISLIMTLIYMMTIYLAIIYTNLSASLYNYSDLIDK